MITYYDQVETSIQYLASSLSYLLHLSLGHLPRDSSQPISMLMDALRWNMLNVIRVELFFNTYKLWDIFLHSSFKSPRGQYALASFVITFLAQFTVQFQLSWLMTIYSLYLITGMCVWLYRRVYFYHRKLDSLGVNQTINHFDANKHLAAVASAALNNGLGNGTTESNYATLKKSSSNQHHNNGNGAPSSATSSTSGGGGSSSSDHTNSLQRQRALAYRDFRSLLTEPRHNHKEFALSLAHLSNISKLVANKDVFDEMHFQILATRRDVVNILLRSILIVAASLLAYVH